MTGWGDLGMLTHVYGEGFLVDASMQKSVQETILGLRKIHTQAKAHYTHKATITKHPFTRHGKAGGFRTEFHSLFQS